MAGRRTGTPRSWAWTPRGTLATHTVGTTADNYTFDAFERLVQATNPGYTATYTYDALDRPAQRNGVAFGYNDLSNNPVHTPGPAGQETLLFRALDGTPLSDKAGAGAARTLLTDAVHDDLIAATTPATGEVTASATYQPYGAPNAVTGTLPLGYQGGWTDPNTAQVNAHARWYNPVAGTFTSRDTWTLPPDPVTQTNRYLYGNGGPTNAIDPSGHDDCYPSSASLSCPPSSGQHDSGGCSLIVCLPILICRLICSPEGNGTIRHLPPAGSGHFGSAGGPIGHVDPGGAGPGGGGTGSGGTPRPRPTISLPRSRPSGAPPSQRPPSESITNGTPIENNPNNVTPAPAIPSCGQDCALNPEPITAPAGLQTPPPIGTCADGGTYPCLDPWELWDKILPDDDPNDPCDFEWYIVAACWIHRHLTIGFDACFFVCIGLGYQHGKVQVQLAAGLALGGKAALPGLSSATPEEQEDPLSPKVCFSGVAGGCWQGGFRNREKGDWWHSVTPAFGEQVCVCLTYNALTWDIGKGDVEFLPKPYGWD